MILKDNDDNINCFSAQYYIINMIEESGASLYSTIKMIVYSNFYEYYYLNGALRL